jgi:hypothetical protein
MNDSTDLDKAIKPDIVSGQRHKLVVGLNLKCRDSSRSARSQWTDGVDSLKNARATTRESG